MRLLIVELLVGVWLRIELIEHEVGLHGWLHAGLPVGLHVRLHVVGLHVGLLRMHLLLLLLVWWLLLLLLLLWLY